MAAIRIALVAALAGCGLLLAGGASGRALDATWSGSWKTSRGFTFAFTQTGTKVTGFAASVSYRFSGTVNGRTLSGVEYGDPKAYTLQGQCEYLKVTLSADGRSFSGFMSGSVTGPAGTVPSCPAVSSGIPYTGTCVGGACAANTGGISRSVAGTWVWQGGRVVVSAAGRTGFKGVLAAPAKGCKLARGTTVWTITRAGTTYRGTAKSCSGATASATFAPVAAGLKVCGAGSCTVARRAG